MAFDQVDQLLLVARCLVQHHQVSFLLDIDGAHIVIEFEAATRNFIGDGDWKDGKSKGVAENHSMQRG